MIEDEDEDCSEWSAGDWEQICSEELEDGKRLWEALNDEAQQHLRRIRGRGEAGYPWYQHESFNESLATAGLEAVKMVVLHGETVAVLTSRGEAAVKAGDDE